MIEHSEGLISPESFEQMIKLLETEADKYHFTSSSEANLLRTINSLYDRKAFFYDLLKYPHHVEIVIAITASSNYLTDIIVRNPEYLYQVFNQEYIERKLNLDELKTEIENGAKRYSSLQAKLNFLKQIKKRYTLKIGLTDILGIDRLKSITGQLSFLASAINAVLFDLCFDEVVSKYKLNIEMRDYCLCSLGKLGGGELNYSSDVDLLLFFEKDFHIDQIKKYYQEILIEAALLFVKSSTEITDRGYIYRVDFRLRPDGLYSPLCRTLAEYIKYYETRGEDWERQMLIKLDFVAGNKNLYKQFYDFLQPYIFPATFSSPLKEQIKKMKSNIEQSNKEKENVKLFSGGIRDIEFTIQALQLLNGGKIKELRTGNSLSALPILKEQSLISQNEHDVLSEAYIFYRRIEHFLQLMNDRQTHLIPEQGELLGKLTNYLGIGSTSDFKDKLNLYRKSVRQIYDDILKSEDQPETNPYNKIIFKDNNRAEKNIKYLRSGIGLLNQKEFDTRTINLFDQIEPVLIKYLEDSAAADKVIENFVKVTRISQFPSIWYNEFSDKNFFTIFLNICSYSEKAIEILQSDKYCSELLLTRKILTKLNKESFHSLTTNQGLFITVIQFAIGMIDHYKVSEILSNYFDYRVNKLFSDFKINCKYFVAALGSYGSVSVNFSSDIDLIVVIDKITEDGDVQKDFQTITTKLQQEIKPFEIDFRLRPEGKNSPLAWGIKEYKEYLNSRARIWEFQALTKLRFICGDKELFNEIKKEIINCVKKLNPGTVKTDIRKMLGTIQRELISSTDSFNIKKQRGGLSTIDFIIQSVLLSNHTIFKDVIGKKTKLVFNYLCKSVSKDFKTVQNNYNRLRSIEFSLQNIFNTNNVNIRLTDEKYRLLAEFLKVDGNDELNKELNSIIKTNIQLFEKYVG
ncbi:MAG: hypothetical protein AB1521_14180 [Bacteroidota bacterium]